MKKKIKENDEVLDFIIKTINEYLSIGITYLSRKTKHVRGRQIYFKIASLTTSRNAVYVSSYIGLDHATMIYGLNKFYLIQGEYLDCYLSCKTICGEKMTLKKDLDLDIYALNKEIKRLEIQVNNLSGCSNSLDLDIIKIIRKMNDEQKQILLLKASTMVRVYNCFQTAACN